MVNLLEYARKHVHSTNKDEVLTRAQRLIAAPRLTDAAALMKQLLTKAEFSVFLKEQFSTSAREVAATTEAKERMHARLQNLIRVPWAGILTTNFDDYIRADGFDWRANGTDPDLGHILSRNEPFLVRLHSGDWHSDTVLTSEDYYQTYLNDGKVPGLRLFLKAVMLSYQVVFIGASLEDRVLDVRRELHQTFRGYLPNAWALVPGTQENLDRRDAFFTEHEIKLLPYPVTIPSRPDYWCVDRFLELAAQGSNP